MALSDFNQYLNSDYFQFWRFWLQSIMVNPEPPIIMVDFITVRHAADAAIRSLGFAFADAVSMAIYLLVSLSTAVIVGAGARYAAIASIMLGVGANSTSSLS
jgi:hypothetical protein